MTFINNLTPADITDLRNALLGDPTQLPDGFLGWLPPYIAIRGLDIPVSQVQGFTQFTVNVASPVNSTSSTTSTSYTDLDGGQPIITGLPPGSFLFLYGCEAHSSTSAERAFMAPSFSGAAPSDMDAVASNLDATYTHVQQAKATTHKFTSANNSVKLQYRSEGGGATATFDARWLIALKYANT